MGRIIRIGPHGAFGLSPSPPSGGGVYQSYETAFPVDENPISQSGHWVNGQTVGVQWHDVRTVGGLAYGLQDERSYSDATAVLTGTWAADQAAEAVVYSTPTNPQENCYHEVELRLRSVVSANYNRGYEIGWKCSSTSAAYLIIVRWNGAFGSFNYIISQLNGAQYGVKTGDRVRATIVGNTIRVYKNGVLQATATDDTWTDGNPGMGFNLEQNSGCVGTNPDYGFTWYRAEELSADEPQYLGTGAIHQTDFDSYGPTAQDVWNAAQSPSYVGFTPTFFYNNYDAYSTLVTGRAGTGNALRVAYAGSGNSESHNWTLLRIPNSDYTKPLYITVWARMILAAPTTHSLNVKWIEIWHSSGRIQYNTQRYPIGVYYGLGDWLGYSRFMFYDDPSSTFSGKDHMGTQPIGPTIDSLGRDGGLWHRFTYAYKSHASAGNQDGLVRMWIDGVKIMDISQATLNVTPPTGKYPWCIPADLTNIDTGSDGMVVNVGFPGPQTTGSPAWTLDWDDFVMWQ